MTEMALMPLFVVLGSFYMFAGFVAGKAAMMDAMMDTALAGLTLTPRDSLDVERSGWLLASACAVGAGGTLLSAGSFLALPAFLLSSSMQALHFLVLSPRRYDAAEPVLPQGRRQSLNAFGLYVIVTAFVAWSCLVGQLPTVTGWNIYVTGALVSAWLGTSIWAFHWLLTLGDRPNAKVNTDDEADPYHDIAERQANLTWAKTAHIILVPTCSAYPLIDGESHDALDYLKIEALKLPDPVIDDIWAYSADCMNAIDLDDPLMQAITDSEKANELRKSGERLFVKLQAELGDRVTFQGEFRPNHPKRNPGRLDIVGCPWTTGVFEGWPVTGDDQEIWLNVLGVSFNLMKDMGTWLHEAGELYSYDFETLLAQTTPDQLAHSISTGRTLALRFAKEFAATGRGGIPITYNPFHAAPEDVKL